MDDHSVENGDCKEVEEMAFIDKDKSIDNSEDEYPLLTKEDLMRIDQENPRWRWFRVSLIVLFWVIWFGLIAVSAVYIALTPRCPPRPVQEFWQSGVGYWVNPFAFKDSNRDLVGDLKGLAAATDYISENVGAGFVILTSLTPFYPKKIPLSSGKLSFTKVHPALGDVEDFESFVRTLKKKGLKVVVTLDFNSVSPDHELARGTNLISSKSDEFCLTGLNCAVQVDGSDFYSTYGNESNSVDLNLKSPEVLEEIKNATRFWLSKGADGILLANAAFYVEEGSCIGTSWGQVFPSCKLYTPGTISVIQELRKVVDEESNKSSRSRVLIADPGDTDHSIKAESLLGTKENPGAHVVVSRDFVFGSDLASSLSQFAGSMNASQFNPLALTVASPSDKPYSSLFSTASVFLLPGTPLVYAGSELGWSPENGLPPEALYPFGEKPVIGNVASHLCMPWDSRGVNFSDSDNVGDLFEKYITDLNITETVETAMAAGRGSSIFGLTQSLIKLRKNTPSLQWGNFNLATDLTSSKSISIFKRSAPGFDSVFVVMVRSGGSSSVIDFSANCSSLTPLVVYPPNSAFEPGVEIPNLKVYFKSSPEDNLYVFKCVA
ncbi:unnamed protein product [Hymenolepis diminuta]|uniref:Aamy domain-containing protein n=1 Tax=Hymenolepis diminuta TaxID=6216 RepID=A0A0R3SFW2_HYMDI|nr:unnamed protein product [Hymenolepis diminuta]VUZ51166.1 unnamed protein product [Hymenolepis diminuta]